MSFKLTGTAVTIYYCIVGLHTQKQNAENIFVGDRVLIASKRAGTVQYVGNTEFAPGMRCSSFGSSI